MFKQLSPVTTLRSAAVQPFATSWNNRNSRPIFGQNKTDSLPILTAKDAMEDNIPMCSSGSQGTLSTDKGQPHGLMDKWWCHQHPELAGGLLLLGTAAYLGKKHIRKVFKSIKSKIGLKRTS